ncbi:MAG: sensor-containing diguanylate cyclase/phosphodiesterase [Frankiales bacterium]|nr:sensor-containing diguanylate cyclase/phosphodiesterase [Frankiales bacterium]
MLQHGSGVRSPAVPLGALLLLVVAGQLPTAVREPVWDVAFVLLPLAAALAAGRAAAAHSESAAAWRSLRVACLAWAAGSVAWGVEQLVLRDPEPFPSVADVGYLAFPLLALAALLRLPGVPLRTTGRLRLLLDGLVVAASLLVLAWLGTLGNLARADGDALGVAVGLAFPVLDVLVASVVVVVLSRLRCGLRDARVQVALGVVGVAAADTLYAVLAGRGAYDVGGPCDLLYAGSFLLLTWAGRSPVGSAAAEPGPAGSRLLPGVPALLAGGALLVSGRLHAGLGTALTGLTVLLVTALVVRGQLLGLESDALSQGLEEKVAERTAALDAARARSSVDALTGLPHRAAFVEALQTALASGAPVGVVLLDLDGFKEVNDGFGHDAGDALLVAVAGRLREAVRGDVVLARLGGDEFAVMVRDPEAARVVAGLAARLVALLEEPVRVPPVDLVLGASAGTAVVEPGGSVHHLLRDADTAMYAAKAAGRGQVRAFDPAMHAAVRDRILLESDLRQALVDDELEVHYQPVVDLVADRVTGFEALARWTSPVRGPVSPVDFVPAAERTGLVVELERRVLEMACTQVALWRRTSPALTVAVNVSARHLSEPDFLDDVLGALARHGLPTSALVVEVTESLLFHDDDVVLEVLQRLHTAGVGLALDDFGTGYSSLSRLASYPFDILKIDRAFVGGLDDGRPGSPVLVAALAMARGLGMTVVAEGVETEPQLDFLVAHGCESAQGYLLSRPGPALLVGATIGRGLLPTPRLPAR